MTGLCAAPGRESTDPTPRHEANGEAGTNACDRPTFEVARELHTVGGGTDAGGRGSKWPTWSSNCSQILLVIVLTLPSDTENHN